MKIKGIKYKVTRLVLIISLSAMLVVSVVSAVGMLTIRNRTATISNNLGTQAADGSKGALETLALNQLISLTQSKTIYADAKLDAVREQTLVISDMAADIYNNPDGYGETKVLPPSAENEGTVVSQLLWADDADLSDIDKVGNISNVLDSTAKRNGEVFCTEFGSENGYLIVSDTTSASKAGMTSFDPRTRSWYTDAKQNGTLTWSDLVEDGYGRGLGIVCTNPVYDKNGVFRGVAGISMVLTELSETITNEELGETSYAFAVDSSGSTVIMPGLETLDDRINLFEANDPALHEMAQKMVNGETGVARITLYGKEVYAAYAPLSSINWSICTVISVDEILQPALINNSEIEKYTEYAVKRIDSGMVVIISVLAGIILIAAVALTIISAVFAKRLTKPIEQLTASVSSLGGNDEIKYISQIKTADEIQVLSDTFEDMTERLSGYIANLTSVTAEKERIGAELDIAAKIQLSELPRQFPAFPDNTEFDIYALMTPAKEVGGDFYDYFLVDENHLAVVIADVSGKGIPAAMFMMIAKTHIKTHAGIGKSPADTLAAANNALCENNDAEMFVTAFMGILEISTGKFTYANAGHNPPLMRRANGNFEWLKVRPGFVLGGMPDIRYRQDELYFGKGDMFFMYTDGVTEATDKSLELYGNERLEQALNAHADLAPKQLVEEILSQLNEFSKNTEQADDITMTALQYFSPKNREQYEINLPAEKAQLQVLLDHVGELLEQHNCSPKAQYQIEVCIEEIFVNIASYAYGGKSGPARVMCEFRKNDDGTEQAVLTFYDDGVPYNPLNRETPDISLGAEDREIGGLGIFMTMKMMDKTEYEYKGENIFRMYKNI